jgi:hypothetical protein
MLRKHLISYYKTCLWKHDAYHFKNLIKFEEEVNFVTRGSLEKQLVKKRVNISSTFILIFFPSKTFLKKTMWSENILENLRLLLIINHLHLLFIKSVWLKHLIFHFCPQVYFVPQKFFSNDDLLNLVEKTKHMFCLSLTCVILPLLVLIFRCLRVFIMSLP